MHKPHRLQGTQKAAKAAPLFRADPARWKRDRYALYREYREADPILWGQSPNPALAGCWYLFRYHDVERALGDPRLGREEPGSQVAASCPFSASAVSPGLMEMDQRWMIHRDPPAHDVLRRWLGQVVSAQMVQKFAPRIASLIDESITSLPTAGPIDFMTPFAEALPARMMAEIFGFETGQAGEFANAAVSLLSTRRPSANYGLDRAELARQLGALVKERQSMPRADLVSLLITTRLASGDGSPSARELVSNCLFLLITGYQVTVDLLGNGLWCLLGRPKEFDMVRSDSIRLSKAIEECLRFESPLQMVDRWVLEDMEICGKSFRKGQRVYLVLGAANRDPSVFSDPDRLHLSREEARHLAFGTGRHACLGSLLARTLAKGVFQMLPARLDQLALSDFTPAWQAAPFFRSLQALPVHYKRKINREGGPP